MTDIATERLFFDAEKTKLVREGDPEAKILAAAVGDEIPEGFKAPAGTKESAKAANKQTDAAENKGVTIVTDDDDDDETPTPKKPTAKKAASK